MLDWVSHAELERMVYAAGHSLWVGGLVGIVLWAMLRLTPAMRTGARYSMALAALVLVVASHPVAYGMHSFVVAASAATSMAQFKQAPDRTAQSVVASSAAEPNNHPSRLMPRLQTSHIDWIELIGATWLAGSAIMLVRMMVSLRGARRLVARGEDGSASPAGEAMGRLMRRMGWRRRIRLVLVKGAGSPAVVGVLRPVLLVPAAIACEMSPQQLEAILLHELAHIRRHDYLVNVAQMLVEALLFFNPAVWFISRQIRIEREACCDAFAARATGEPLAYAQALGAVMGRLAAPAAMAASGQGRLDRVKRLLVPGHRPGLRLSAPMLAATLAAGIVLLAGLWKTTNIAVAAAADWMSDKERVDKITEVQKQMAQETPEGKVALAGRVVTSDGSPLPRIRWGHGNVKSQNSSTGFSFDVKPDGQFKVSFPSGSVALYIVVENYGPAVWGPITVNPGETREDIKLMLRPAQTGRIAVVEQDGSPIAGIELTVTQLLHHGSSTQWIDTRKVVTDDKGILEIPGLGDLPISVQAEVPGYQEASAEYSLKDGQTPRLELRRAKTLAGQVTAEGKPVADARIVKVFQRGTVSRSWHPLSNDVPLLARTDAQGRFSINTFDDTTVYSIAVIADKYAPHLLYEITSASKPLAIELTPAVHIRGKVFGTPEQLRKFLVRGRNAPAIQWQWTVQVARSHSYGIGSQTPAHITGNEATFDITGFGPGKIRVGEAPHAVDVDARKDVDDLVIDLRKKSAKLTKTREVRLRIKTPPGAPAAQGTIKIAAVDPADATNSMMMMEKTVTNGVATFVAPVDKPIRYERGKLTGYWIVHDPFAPPAIVSDGDGPFIHDLEARPAGAVHGMILDAQGKPLNGACVSLITIDRPDDPTVKFPPFADAVQTGTDGKYLLTPLTFGGTYRIAVSGQSSGGGDQYVASEPFTVTGAKPLAQANLQMVHGVDVTARVVDEAGKPIPAATIYQSLSTRGNSFGRNDRQTDAQGRFTIRNLDPNWPGKLLVVVRPQRDYAGAESELKIQSGEQTIALKRGASFSGRVVDDATGKGVPGVLVQLGPQTIGGPWIEVVTDDKGEFAASTLENIVYIVKLQDCYPPGTTFEPTGTGSYQIRQPPNSSFAPVDPSKEKRREFRVVMAPWRKM